MKKFVFTCGDTNGIGPEIVIKTLNKIAEKSPHFFYFICPENIFINTAEIIKPEFQYVFTRKFSPLQSVKVSIINIKNVKQELGKPTKKSGKTSFDAIRLSYVLASKNKVDAIITAPISKTAVNLAGINYPGHTEMYADWTGAKNFLMTFLSEKINAGLVTIHEPVKKIPGLINAKNLSEKINISAEMLINDLNIKSPKIALLGLNPHAGEDGLIGKEEEKILKPVIKKHKYKNFLKGPFSSDAFFGNKLYEKFDFVLGMYHDQVLIPFKLMNFGAGVNYTAGLPVIRTSPDHGTAYDIAGKNKADEGSIVQAFRYAEKIAYNRIKNDS